MVLPIALAALLPEVMVAVALLLLLYAADTFFAKPLTAILSQIPIIGAAAARAVASGVAWVISVADDWARWSVGAVVELVHVPVLVVVNVITGIVSTIETIGAYLPRLEGAIRDTIGNVSARVGSILAAVQSVALSVVAVASQAASTAATVAGIIAGTIPHAIAAAVAAAEAFTRSLVGSVETVLRDLLHAAQAAMAAAVAAETAVRAAADGDLLRLIQGQAAVLTAALAEGIGTLRGELHGQVGALEREIEGLHSIVDPIVAAAPIAAIAAIETEIDLMRRTCVDPICGVMTPQLGVLEALLDGAMLLSVIALAGEAIRDPEGTAAATAGVIGTVHGMVADLIDGPLGVAV